MMQSDKAGLSRRGFLGGLAATTTAGAVAAASPNNLALPPTSRSRTFPLLDIVRIPDRVRVFEGLDHPLELTKAHSTWQANGLEIEFQPNGEEMKIIVSSPAHELTHVHLRWTVDVVPELRCLGDAWERSYGDLAWRGIIPERAMPWYFLTRDGTACHGYGVKTGAGTLCFWQVDQEGVSLWMNLCNGGDGVQLGNRRLAAATVISREAKRDEAPIASARAFCRAMCERPRLAEGALYGSNDWYYAYGKNSAQQTIRDADLMAELSSGLKVRPFTVIDDGWRDPSRFPDMHAVTADIKRREVRPGIWIRPLIAPADTPKELVLPAHRFGSLQARASDLAYDPTVPDALALVLAKAKEVVGFGFELVKHDYSTYDLLGQWGFEMGAQPTSPGWSLHDRTRTNAEVIRDLYMGLRKSVGEQTLLLGCNTVGHLGAGIFELQRTGDDTSGQQWERTRRMGVNTLAFRLPQNGTFFAQDPDCVGITPAIPWEYNRQWLDVIARSGATVFVSPDPPALGAEQKKAISEAFRIAAEGGAGASADDWFETISPERWANPGASQEATRYRWCSQEGADPFFR
ncbi:MAG TPA: twin-arginine translocation signal domain-containing protein [Terracidiphilus sp.]|jgi:alpha-galactosidase